MESVDAWLTSHPIAHRGLFDEAAGAPENSLPAFRRAVRQGVPFELDVQLSKDGLLVVVHDSHVTLTSGERFPVADLDQARLQQIRIAPSGGSLATLPQVLELVDGQVPFVVDVRRWRPALHTDLERAVADQTRDYRGPLAFQSFDPLAVYRLKRLVGDRPVGQLSGVLRTAGPVTSLIGRTMVTNALTRPDFISYELSMLPSRYVDFWRRNGLPLIAFPVHSEAEEVRATTLADNFFFSGFTPRRYRKDS